MAVLVVVDDEVDLLALVALRLRAAGHEVRQASSAADALAVVAEHGLPDLGLFDICMPEVDGVALLEALLAEHGDRCPPVLFMSAWADPERLARAAALGAGCIVKPFRVRDVVAAVERAL